MTTRANCKSHLPLHAKRLEVSFIVSLDTAATA